MSVNAEVAFPRLDKFFSRVGFPDKIPSGNDNDNDPNGKGPLKKLRKKVKQEVTKLGQELYTLIPSEEVYHQNLTDFGEAIIVFCRQKINSGVSHIPHLKRAK